MSTTVGVVYGTSTTVIVIDGSVASKTVIAIDGLVV